MAELDRETKEQVEQTFYELFADPDLDRSRFLLEMTWYRNILYYLGEQWLSWFNTTNTFGRRYPLGGTLPTPVENIIRDYVRSMKALTLNKTYALRVWPNSNDLQDIEAAALGEKVLRWLDSLNDYEIEDVKEDIELWRQLTGNGFARTFADVDDGVFVLGKDKVPKSKGTVGTESLIPFNVYPGFLGRTVNKKMMMGIKSLKDREWVEDTFKIKVNWENIDRRQVQYEQQLLQMVANVSPWKGQSVETGMMEEKYKNLCVFKEIEFAPTAEFPEGRYAIMVNSDVIKVVNSLPIPKRKDGSWEFTITHFPYNQIPGSFFASSGIDDLISPQNTINEVDQALAINRKSLGRPIVLTPAELIMKRRSARGQALLHLQYDGRTAAGAKPIIHPGTPYPQQILEEKNQHKEAAQTAAGDPKNILRGHSPHSGASGVMVDILRESAEASHSPDIRRFYRRWGEVQRKRLTMAQTLITETRMAKIPGEGNKVQIVAFKGADLKDNTDVRLELDSGASTTNAGRNEIMTRLIEVGFFGDLAMKPRLQRHLSKRMGIQVPDEYSVHREKAEWENAVITMSLKEEYVKIAFPNAPMPDPETGEVIKDKNGKAIGRMFPKSYDPSFRLDNHEIHIQAHDEQILSKQFRALPKLVQQLLVAHRDMHDGALQQIQDDQTAQLATEAALGIQQQGGGAVPRATGPRSQERMGASAPPAKPKPAEM